MHLYRYFSVRGDCAQFLNKLCVETSDINGDEPTYYCKDYLTSHKMTNHSRLWSGRGR